ncbi:MAG: BlaI/MecI/CopY family transcriptional regulator [Bacteroidota bacterium]
MEKLTKTEEPVMQIIWSLGSVFVRDIIKELPEPKPPYNTISSLVRILEDKGMVGHKAYGRTYEYFPLVSKAAYRKHIFGSLVKNYFDNSYADLMSFMAKDSNLSTEEQEDLKDFIKKHYD